MIDDKLAEQARYDRRAARLQSQLASGARAAGAASVASYLRAPYTFYEASIRERVGDGTSVLEIGSGTGEFTAAALAAGAAVTATDISERSLEALSVRFAGVGARLTPLRADMESLPFGQGTFDVVISAGSLSYGDNHTVVEEIHRVTKPGGRFICVDSLNHNPLYKINRYVHHLRGERTASTLRRMPTIELIEAYGKRFGSIEVRYFGSASWFTPVASKVIGDDATAALSDRIDRWIGVRRSAFKFVMIATKMGG
jgi:ubiquinone/menaquinone biosynthesis C-methylase UbiE